MADVQHTYLAKISRFSVAWFSLLKVSHELSSWNEGLFETSVVIQVLMKCYDFI
jgi:hypothetical protein